MTCPTEGCSLSADPAWPVWAVRAKDAGQPGPWDGPAQLPAWPPTEGQTSESLVTLPPGPQDCSQPPLLPPQSPRPPDPSGSQSRLRRCSQQSQRRGTHSRTGAGEASGPGPPVAKWGAGGTVQSLGTARQQVGPRERKLGRAGRGLLCKMHVAGGHSRGARGTGPAQPQPGSLSHIPELCLQQHGGAHIPSVLESSIFILFLGETPGTSPKGSRVRISSPRSLSVTPFRF